jgi:hypothetical protein
MVEDDQDKFAFHVDLLGDKALIVDRTEQCVHIKKNSHDYVFAIADWRLTAEGHEFASALVKPTVLTTIKEKFQDEGFTAVIDVAKQIGVKLLEKKLNDLDVL